MFKGWLLKRDMTERGDVYHLELLSQLREFSWKEECVPFFRTQLISHWSLSKTLLDPSCFSSLSAVHCTSLGAVLTPGLSYGSVSTQALKRTSWGSKSLILSLVSRHWVIQAWWRSSWRWKLNYLVFSDIVILNDSRKHYSFTTKSS